MDKWLEYLKYATDNGASDIFFVAGGSACIKLDGRMKQIDGEKLFPKDTEECIHRLYKIAERSMEAYLENGDDDFSFAVAGMARFRVNAYRQRGSMAAVVRVVAFDIPDWKEFHIPEEVMSVSNVNHGMVLVTGTAGSGKSTTQACIIDQINKTKECHIITLEDPIEYLHRNRKSIVSQREVAIDTKDYLAALRACLRQAPDVILLGEMRDKETIHTAMSAAETGHLLIATLHTKGAVNTIDRIVDTFPSGQQDQIRIQLSMVLHTVVSQQLIPGINGEMIPAFEIMHMNNAIRSLVRENKTHQIDNVIAAGGSEGMISMDQSILSLYKSENISKETALEYADNQEQMKRRMGLLIK
ncbi:twitching mobility protein [Clostridiales bacterium]|nr:twitching mobility protein [Clostridiales bacterium]